MYSDKTFVFRSFTQGARISFSSPPRPILVSRNRQTAQERASGSDLPCGVIVEWVDTQPVDAAHLFEEQRKQLLRAACTRVFRRILLPTTFELIDR